MTAPTAVETTASYDKYIAAAQVVLTRADTTLADEAHDLLLWADRLSREELEWLIGLAGRVYGPAFLEEAVSEAKVTAETVTALVGPIWSSTEYPDRELDRDTWRWLFDVAGFTADGKPAVRPEKPLLLYRGSVPERRTDWSWTRDRAVAERFAEGPRGRGKGRLWVCEVPPAHMLAVNTERDEDEIVVDTRGLEIREASR